MYVCETLFLNLITNLLFYVTEKVISNSFLLKH